MKINIDWAKEFNSGEILLKVLISLQIHFKFIFTFVEFRLFLALNFIQLPQSRIPPVRTTSTGRRTRSNKRSFCFKCAQIDTQTRTHKQPMFFLFVNYQNWINCKESIFGKWKFSENISGHLQCMMQMLILRVKQSGCAFANLCFCSRSVCANDRESVVSVLSVCFLFSLIFCVNRIHRMGDDDDEENIVSVQ